MKISFETEIYKIRKKKFENYTSIQLYDKREKNYQHQYNDIIGLILILQSFILR